MEWGSANTKVKNEQNRNCPICERPLVSGEVWLECPRGYENVGLHPPYMISKKFLEKKNMKESDIKLIEGLDLLRLTTLETTLLLEKFDGKKDADEYLKVVQDEISKRRPYSGNTDGELENLHFQMSRLANEGQDFLEPMQNIENELIRRDEEKIDREIQSRNKQGIIYETE